MGRVDPGDRPWVKGLPTGPRSGGAAEALDAASRPPGTLSPVRRPTPGQGRYVLPPYAACSDCPTTPTSSMRCSVSASIAVSMRRATSSTTSANRVTAATASSSPHPATYGTLSPRDVEPGARTDDVGDGVDEDLGLRTAVLPVADAQRVRELVK